MDGGLDKVFYMLILADVLALVVSHSEREKVLLCRVVFGLRINKALCMW